MNIKNLKKSEDTVFKYTFLNIKFLYLKKYMNRNFYYKPADIQVGNKIKVIQKKGKYRPFFNGLVIKVEKGLNKNVIYVLNKYKKDLILKKFNLFGKTIKKIVVLKNKQFKNKRKYIGFVLTKSFKGIKYKKKKKLKGKR